MTPPAKDLPKRVRDLRAALNSALNSTDDSGRVVSNAKFGAYVFYDFDGEPIYVGQTSERLRTRIRRHLTNQRTDAVAMNVLDPAEVAEIEMWPRFDLDGKKADDDGVKATLNALEFAVFSRAVAASEFGAVLNEGEISETEPAVLPDSLRVRIMPDELFEESGHPDIRIARRASTIASLARVISERQVSDGLRRVLHVQAQRLEYLARRRMGELGLLPDEEGSDG